MEYILIVLCVYRNHKCFFTRFRIQTSSKQKQPKVRAKQEEAAGRNVESCIILEKVRQAKDTAGIWRSKIKVSIRVELCAWLLGALATEPPLYGHNIMLRKNSHENEVSSKVSEHYVIWSGEEFGKVFAEKNDFMSSLLPPQNGLWRKGWNRTWASQTVMEMLWKVSFWCRMRPKGPPF